MSRIIALAMLAVMVGACGIKKPLIRPKEIPAYEAKRAKKMQKFEPQPEMARPMQSVQP